MSFRVLLEVLVSQQRFLFWSGSGGGKPVEASYRHGNSYCLIISQFKTLLCTLIKKAKHVFI